MGTKMGPSYACLFMGYLEQTLSQHYDGPVPELYLRYIDDGIGISSMPEADLLRYLDFIKNYHPTIKYTSVISTSSVNFLDIKVSLTLKGLHTSVHYKDTDSHSYLQYSSSHPLACKNSIPYSQLLRLRRLCMSDDDFLCESTRLLDFFRARGYPENILSMSLSKIQLVSRQEALTPSASTTSERTKLVLTFHPHNRAVSKILFENLSILAADEDTRFLTDVPPLLVHRRASNLRDILVNSRLHRSSTVGNIPCGKPKCTICKYVFSATFVKGPLSSHRIKDKFLCTSRNLVYGIQCRRCGLVLYTGETGRTLEERCSEHIRAINLASSHLLPTHFNQSDHDGLADFQITGLLLCHGSASSRFQQEQRLVQRLGTAIPHGLNTLVMFN